MKRFFNELKLGVFVLGALVLLFFAALSLKDVSFLKGTYIIKVKFDFVEGLKPASPVRYCGVDVGEVKRLVVKNDENHVPYVYVYAKVEENVKIPQGSDFFINSLSLFGEKYLEIIPPAVPTTAYIQPDSLIEGINSPPLFNVVSAIHATVKKFDNFISKSEIKKSLEETIENITIASREIKLLLIDVRNQKGTIGRLFYDESLYEKTEELVDDIKENPWKLFYRPKKSHRFRPK